MRTLCLLWLAGASSAFCQPALPFFDWGACPYEGCAYKQWTAHRAVTVYDTWKEERKPIAQIAAGDKVTGASGAVVTLKPGVIRMDRDLPAQGLHRGDTVLTYAVRGEGFYSVWLQGKYQHDFDLTFAKLTDGTGCGGDHCAATFLDMGKALWWAQVKLASGLTGWVEMDLAQVPIALY